MNDVVGQDHQRHDEATTPNKTMRRIGEGEVPFAAGTAIQDIAERPVFHGNGPFDYVCVECGNVLASAMDPEHMTKKVRIRCGRCRTVNVAVTDEPEAADRRPGRRGRGS